MKILLVFLFCFFLGPTATAKPQKKASFWSSLFQRESSSQSTSKRTALKRKKQPRNKAGKNNSRELLSKEIILASTYYNPKKTRKELISGLNQELTKIEDLCEEKILQLSQIERESYFNKSLSSLLKYIESNLKSDPYMIYELKLMFGDIKDTIIETFKSSIENKEDSELTFSAFERSYHLLYNLPEDTKLEDYPHDWAKKIAKGLKCLSQENEEGEKIVSLPFIKDVL